ncbi:MAG: hypothetical protein RSC41_00075, partial [Oscillospiraceae bacterium]
PSACKADALPAELCSHIHNGVATSNIDNYILLCPACQHLFEKKSKKLFMPVLFSLLHCQPTP